MMANFKNDILEAVDGEPIEAIVIGPFADSYVSNRGTVPKDKIGTAVSWREAESWLDYEYSDGFGGEDCHPIFVWTATRVFFVHEYDGSTRLYYVPRFSDPPTGQMPAFL